MEIAKKLTRETRDIQILLFGHDPGSGFCLPQNPDAVAIPPGPPEPLKTLFLNLETNQSRPLLACFRPHADSCIHPLAQQWPQQQQNPEDLLEATNSPDPAAVGHSSSRWAALIRQNPTGAEQLPQHG